MARLDKVFTDAQRDAIEAALEALVSTSMFDHEAAALATLRRLDRDGWQLVDARRRDLLPEEAIVVVDKLCAQARRAALADARASFEESLRAHGGRLDAEDVESVLAGLDET